MKSEAHDKTFNKRTFFLLWILCLIGTWSVFPYVHYLGTPEVSMGTVFIIGTVQAAVLYGLICWLSYKIVPKTDLHPFKNTLQIYPAIIAGGLVGLAIFLFDKWVFQSSLLAGAHPPAWAGALASIYGAVNEEVLLRLFLFTLIYLLLKKGFSNRLFVLWSTNILVALIFGLGHLPAAFKVVSPSTFEIFRILLLNGIAGLVFGWLYWSRGLWTAMAAHFVADLVIHVFIH